MGGGKTEDGAHLWSQFSRMPRGTGKNRRHPGDMHGFLQLCLMVLAEAGTSKSPGGAWSGPTEISKNTCICQERETLLQLANLENELGGGISLTSFIAGFHLGTGIAGEYCFEDGAERRAARKMKIERIPIKD